MAKVRQVNTFFWDDPYIEELCPEGKLLFLYLITNPLTNIAGSFEISTKRMHEHTGITRDRIAELLKRFEADGKVIYKDRWMLTVNTIQHQSLTTPTIRAGIAAIISDSPQWVKDRVCIAYEWLSHLNLNLNLNSNSIKHKNGVPPSAAVAAAVEKKPDDAIETMIWKDGIALLSRSGMTDKQARPFLGRHAKEYGKLKLAEAIAVSMAANPPDPKAYLVATLQQRAKKAVAAVLGVGRHDPQWEPSPVEKCPRCGSDVCLGGKACEERAKAK